MRWPGVTGVLELERELDGTLELLGRELEVNATLLEVAGRLELLGRELDVTATLLEVAGTLELLGRELEVAGILELLGRELLDVTGVELPPTMPYGAGWDAQVEREIQLLLFSYPHPLCVVTHRG